MARPLQSEVVARVRAVSAVYVRARVEGGLRYSSGESKRKWKALGQRLVKWCEAFDGFSPAERRRMRNKLGTWSDRDQTNGFWRLEALGVLVWALSLKRTIQ